MIARPSFYDPDPPRCAWCDARLRRGEAKEHEAQHRHEDAAEREAAKVQHQRDETA